MQAQGLARGDAIAIRSLDGPKIVPLRILLQAWRGKACASPERLMVNLAIC